LPEFVTAATAHERGALALDLFAGVGLLTLPLARQFDQVVAVEGNHVAAADLAANTKAHSLENVRAVSGTVFDFLRRYARSEPDLVVVDPPRAGVGSDTLRFIAALQPRRIHYASCHPPTLARDLGYLIARGFALNSVELFDFFPQTYHIECVAKLVPLKT
jgi:23S rRNA (uracil1939-C5)-methyltransferase